MLIFYVNIVNTLTGGKGKVSFQHLVIFWRNYFAVPSSQFPVYSSQFPVYIYQLVIYYGLWLYRKGNLRITYNYCELGTANWELLELPFLLLLQKKQWSSPPILSRNSALTQSVRWSRTIAFATWEGNLSILFISRLNFRKLKPTFFRRRNFARYFFLMEISLHRIIMTLLLHF